MKRICSLVLIFMLLAGAGVFFYLERAKQPKAKVYIKKTKAGHYQLMAEGRPYIVKGVCYNPIPIGQSYDYDWWSDPAAPWLTDGKLMKKMGVNTIRLYQANENIEKGRKVIRDFYQHYGIRTVLGHWLGFWEYPCPRYGDKSFQDRIKKEVLAMVAAYKDEPGILMWVLGNENNYSCWGRVNPWSSDEIDQEVDPQKKSLMRARVYYSFVNELAKEIRRVDPDHPVALGNGELVGLEVAREVAPEVDLVACIIYRGRSFGNLFQGLKNIFDKPMLLSEFGADSYDAALKKEDQDMQAFFLEAQWRQVYDNLAGNPKGAGNVLGGIIFEWTDEWWKHNSSSPDSWKVHDTEGGWSSGSYYFDINVPGNMNMNEEYFGIVALSESLEDGLNKRIPKKSYYVIKEFWSNPSAAPKVKNPRSK